ncbi:hypothetical protein [Halomonas nitroreducens]|uniref:Uncharacterized protein n=1 Tax=Halomonas nitroreducens TaxID=447425 RepID=A0A431V0C5_9GAMM|nr:hypothetical protein [Halomonas nitroreducens]RTQ99927.1 hypothetical protein EKG36_17020 [Halomonas nitroreducens]
MPHFHLAPPPMFSAPGWRHLTRIVLCLALSCLVGGPAAAQDAATRERWREAIAASSFEAPLSVVSEARDYGVSGSIHARISRPLPVLTEELTSAAAWCEILFLHLNVEACRHEPHAKGAEALSVHVGRRGFQPLEKAQRIDLTLEVRAVLPRYLSLGLEGDRGPYGTRNFRLRLQAMTDGEAASLVHLRYSLAYGTPARLALWAYFNTIGRDRVGFTVVGREADGAPRYVGGVRGMIERNVMRFYLALEVHLATLSLPEPGRLETRLRRWFAATERYPRQLHELDEATYLAQKRRELAR